MSEDLIKETHENTLKLLKEMADLKKVVADLKAENTWLKEKCNNLGILVYSLTVTWVIPFTHPSVPSLFVG